MPDARTIYAEGDMRRRKDRGAAIVAAYAEECFGNEADREDVLMVAGDAVADVLHLAAFRGIDPEEVLRKGRYHFRGDFEDVDDGFEFLWELDARFGR